MKNPIIPALETRLETVVKQKLTAYVDGIRQGNLVKIHR